MKLITIKEKIFQAVVLAERVVGKKESLPILSCALIEAGKDCIVRATNLESAIEITVPAEASEKGLIAVPASVLSQTLRAINSDKITFTEDNQNLLVEARGSKTLIKAVPHDEFPKIPAHTGKKSVTLPRGAFLKGLQAVSYAASVSMIRPELGSVFLSLQSGEMTFVATDSFRLAEKKIPCKSSSDIEMLLPLKHAGELSYILERINEESVVIAADESQLSLSAGGVRFISRIVDGNFPNYKEIMPKKFTTEAMVLKNDLSEMLKKARVFSGSEQHVGLHLYPKKKIFSATAQAPEVGEMSDSIDAALEGDDIDIKFHVSYVSECLPLIESDSVILGFSGAGKPLVVRGVSDASYTYLVMPLNR